jgi:ethanolaminephosphotransferase
MCEVKYITPAGEEALKTFKYKGGSDSILYEFLWSPLSEFIVSMSMLT